MSIPCCVGHLKNVRKCYPDGKIITAAARNVGEGFYPSLIMNTSFDTGDVLEQEIEAD